MLMRRGAAAFWLMDAEATFDCDRTEPVKLSDSSSVAATSDRTITNGPLTATLTSIDFRCTWSRERTSTSNVSPGKMGFAGSRE